MTDVEVVDELVAIADLMNRSWAADVFPLQVSIVEFNRLAGVLEGYRGSGIIQDWHTSYLLAGCRRAVDHSGDDPISIRKALHRLRKLARDGRADIDALNDARLRGNPSLNAEDRSDVIRAVGGDRAEDVLHAVQEDLDTIRDVADRVHAIATHQVAHRLDRDPPEPVTGDDVVQLVGQLAGIHRRWSITLRATDVVDTHDDQRLLTTVVKALELFDWHDYVQATSEAMKEFGPAAGVSFDQLDAAARIEYRFDI